MTQHNNRKAIVFLDEDVIAEAVKDTSISDVVIKNLNVGLARAINKFEGSYEIVRAVLEITYVIELSEEEKTKIINSVKELLKHKNLDTEDITVKIYKKHLEFLIQRLS